MLTIGERMQVHACAALNLPATMATVYRVHADYVVVRCDDEPDHDVEVTHEGNVICAALLENAHGFDYKGNILGAEAAKLRPDVTFGNRAA